MRPIEHAKMAILCQDLRRQLLDKDRRNVLLDPVGLAMRARAEASEARHLSTRPVARALLLPMVVHDARLPLVVDGTLRGEERVVRPPGRWAVGGRCGAGCCCSHVGRCGRLGCGWFGLAHHLRRCGDFCGLLDRAHAAAFCYGGGGDCRLRSWRIFINRRKWHDTFRWLRDHKIVCTDAPPRVERAEV